MKEFMEITNRVRNTDYIFIYQMGKVASTSLMNSINKYNYEARQTHFLGNSALQEILNSILSPYVNDFFYFHNKGQLEENIENMRIINLLKHFEKPIKIITLSREPTAWFWSAITQQYDGLFPKYERFAKLMGFESEDKYKIVYFFYKSFFNFCQEYNVSVGVYIDSQAMMNRLKEKLNNPNFNLFFDHLSILNGPLVWFDRFMLEVFNIDVYGQEFVNDYAIVKTGNNIETLVLKYENINDLTPVIGEFLNIENFELKKDNTSESKEQFNIMKNIKEEFNLSLLESLNIKNTRYVKHFNY